MNSTNKRNNDTNSKRYNNLHTYIGYLTLLNQIQ